MTGERDLDRLLATMEPELRPGQWVFATVETVPDDLDPVVTVREPEGTTVVVERDQADRRGLTYLAPSAMITLRVHSALDAVGLTAAVSRVLTEHGISCNVVAGYFHDHLLVPHDRADEAVRLLAGLASERPADPGDDPGGDPAEHPGEHPRPGELRPTAAVAQLSVRRGVDAVAFYVAAFGAVEVYRVGGDDAMPELVSQLAVGEATFWVSDEAPEVANFSPETLGGPTARMLLVVEDPRQVITQAVGAGARLVDDATEEHGWLLGRVLDPFGHHWEIGRPLVGWPPHHP